MGGFFTMGVGGFPRPRPFRVVAWLSPPYLGPSPSLRHTAKGPLRSLGDLQGPMRRDALLSEGPTQGLQVGSAVGDLVFLS